MNIVQNQDTGCFKLAQFVQQSGEHHFEWLERGEPIGEQQIKRLLAKVWMELLAGGNDVAPEANRVVIALVQRDIGNPGKVRTSTSFGEPLSDRRCFAVAC